MTKEKQIAVKYLLLGIGVMGAIWIGGMMLQRTRVNVQRQTITNVGAAFRNNIENHGWTTVSIDGYSITCFKTEDLKVTESTPTPPPINSAPDQIIDLVPEEVTE